MRGITSRPRCAIRSLKYRLPVAWAIARWKRKSGGTVSPTPVRSRSKSVSTGDDDIALKGSNNPNPVGFGIDGNRDKRSDRAHGIVIAHNHIYWGHGISIGSETNAGVTNVHVYDNSFQDSEEGLRIKSDYARGGEVSNIDYRDICIKDAQNALLFTTYYSTKSLPGTGPKVPNFHDISLSNVRIMGSAMIKLQGFAAGTGGYFTPTPAIPTGYLPGHPLGMTMTDVLADDPALISVIASDANLTLSDVNLPIAASTANNIVVSGASAHTLRRSSTAARPSSTFRPSVRRTRSGPMRPLEAQGAGLRSGRPSRSGARP